jgi:hypothetical protein
MLALMEKRPSGEAVDRLVALFANPSDSFLQKPIARGCRSKFRTSHGGVYVWYADTVLAEQSCLSIPREGAWDLTTRLIIYVGESHGRTVCKRLKAESRLRADQSQPQMGFGCLLRDALGLELRRVRTTPQYVDFIPNKNRLFEWMQSHARFAFVEVPDASTVGGLQFELIERLRPLVNLHRRLDMDHPFESQYRTLKNEMRNRADLLPPV